jgi:DNA replicative helicase MCM subunit Mcm2 (Cdc46/Mcm family)
MLRVTEFIVPEELRKKGVSRIAKEASTIMIQHDNKPIRFDIDSKKWSKTMENFYASANGLIDQETKQAIAFYLSEQWLNLHNDSNGKPIEDIDNISGKDTHRDLSDNNEEEQEKESTKTVAEAKRIHFGRVTVTGTIVIISDLYQLVTKAGWKCDSCVSIWGKQVRKLIEPPAKPKQCPFCESYAAYFEEMHEYINAVTITIQDDIAEPSLDSSMPVVVFEEDTKEIHMGENVKVIGKIEKIQDKKSRKYHSVLVAESVHYEHRKRLILTHNDTLANRRFVGKLPVYGEKAFLVGFKDRIIRMFAPNVIGHEHEKLALILGMIGAPENSIRGRINELLIGPAGLAKTKLTREVVKARRGSRYVSAKNTTGKSLTAMVLKEDESYTLNLGPVPLAKNAVCVINEFDKMHPEEQDNLLDVMEEGEIIVNKFAKLRTIKSPTTIIATANPRGNKWKDSDRMSLDEIPFEPIILSRFDILLTLRDIVDEKSNREFAYKKTEYDERNIQHNYNFLEKYMEYAKTLNPIITEEAKSILNEYWVRLKMKYEYASTNRTLESLYRISKAFARLYLSDSVDVSIAYETIAFMSKMFGEFHSDICEIPDPKKISYEETMAVIQQQQTPIEILEAVKISCQRNEQVRFYLGNLLEQSKNKKLRALCKDLLECEDIQRVQLNPTTVRWISKEDRDSICNTIHDLNDLNDLTSRDQQTKNEKKDDGPIFSYNNNVRSQGSQRSRQSEISMDNNLKDNLKPEQIDLFWERFNRLEEQSSDNTVNGTELKADLVSSNRLFVGDATRTVEFIVKTGQIEQIAYDVYRRNSSV